MQRGPRTLRFSPRCELFIRSFLPALVQPPTRRVARPGAGPGDTKLRVTVILAS